MTDLQVRYFLTAARCLNFTEAAKQLYITQPALSQQISALEHELNMQLFVRMKKRLYLTPAAVVLARELPQYEKHLAEILDRAKVANLGVSQTLRLGLMEGQTHPDSWLG
ncbi:MAG: LysR family transcriptional regulator, partial [Oscillospiraceae bacterium]|nr:LysR family transcriptional regulator [Oscillospiraceae bacterium]